MKTRILLAGGLLWLATLFASAAHAAEPERWHDYLDYAYIYASADPATLQSRLDQYGQEAGVSLDDYILEQFEASQSDPLDEMAIRRKAIAYLLRYLSTRDVDALEKSVDAIETFEGQKGRHENLYWFHYIKAHRALEKGDADRFVDEMLDVWLAVVAPLESPYAALEALSLSQSPNSGFVSALPYVYENVARLIVIRSQDMGLARDLDPLAAIVRLLHDGRVGAHPDVVPLEASSKAYLDRIVARLNGPESDGGSLTFTLALFEAGRRHEQARSLLASEGLSAETIKAMGMASGAYETALNRTETPQGEAAVHARVLRQLGEIYAAKQRLGVDPYVETPFTIEDAIGVYRQLFAARNDEDWVELGFRATGYEAYVGTMQRLWEEIQEASLNAADYYLTRSLAEPADAGDHVRSAARTYSRYLSFFDEFATSEGAPFVPDSAYFAAYEAAKGFGDSYLSFSAGNMTSAEIDLVAQRYAMAVRTYPFDRTLWASLAASLQRQGRSNEYLGRARPVADTVARSRSVSSWIDNEEPGHDAVAATRRALADDLVLMFLGFADSSGMQEMQTSLEDLRAKRGGLNTKLVAAQDRRRELEGRESAAVPAAPAPAGSRGASSAPLSRDGRIEKVELAREIAELTGLIGKLDRQIEARERALPIYEGTMTADALVPLLRAQRDHPVHTLLRRMFHEQEV